MLELKLIDPDTDLPIMAQFEHSLLSISKWEEKYEKPFLKEDSERSSDELIDYFLMMAVSPGIEIRHLLNLTREQASEFENYIGKKATATWFSEDKKKQGKKPNRQVVTAELIYYWMFANQIDKSCESWHLNKLLTLIRVFDKQQEDPNKKKKSKSEIMNRNRALNAQRKAAMNTKG